MATTSPFDNEQDTSAKQIDLFAESTGISVVHADFIEERRFDWNLFEGYDSLKVLTYSVSVDAIIRMLESFEFKYFECVFGSETILHDFKRSLRFRSTSRKQRAR